MLVREGGRVFPIRRRRWSSAPSRAVRCEQICADTDFEHYENPVLDGAVDTIRRNRAVMLIGIMGGDDYETASPKVLEQIDVTRRKIEELGYTVTQVFNHDYIALLDDE